MSWNWLSKENIGLARIDLITSLITIVTFFQELIFFWFPSLTQGLWQIDQFMSLRLAKIVSSLLTSLSWNILQKSFLLFIYRMIPNDEANSRIRKSSQKLNQKEREKKVFIEISSRTGKSLPFICFLRNCKNRTLLNQNAINILWIMGGRKPSEKYYNAFMLLKFYWIHFSDTQFHFSESSNFSFFLACFFFYLRKDKLPLDGKLWADGGAEKRSSWTQNCSASANFSSFCTSQLLLS